MNLQLPHLCSKWKTSDNGRVLLPLPVNVGIMAEEVRVRFAPSPTGPLHIGGVRTALYNYLFARRNKGKCILRIEDTDRTRLVKGAEQYIIDSLAWCGIEFDEGVNSGGPYAPYRQSDRKEIYRDYAINLLESGHAYVAFDTPEELDKLRKDHEARKETFQYDHKTRGNLKNSLVMPADEVRMLMDNGAPYVIRILIPDTGQVVLNDLIRGEVRVETSLLDDKVIFKSDGLPTYHLANIVDDHLMKITHVIRGEEWLPSAPLHVLMYRFLGWEDSMPKFAHLPLLLKPDGKGKLSKRDGDRLGFPVFPLQWTDPETGEISSGYRESGYLPEAFINMLAFLGWNPGTEQEIFSMQELIAAFSLENVGKSGSKFSPEKARWFNHKHLVSRSDEEIAALFMPLLKNKSIHAPADYVQKVCSLVKERVHFIEEIWEQSWFFYQSPVSWDEGIVNKRWTPEIPGVLQEISDIIACLDGYDRSNLEAVIKEYIRSRQLNTGQIMQVLRLCMVGSAMGPDIFMIMDYIGRGETIDRISRAISGIGV